MFPARRKILNILEKAKELGRDLHNTEEYQRLQEVNKRLNEDSDALKLIQSFQEAQRRFSFHSKAALCRRTDCRLSEQAKNLSQLNILAYEGYGESMQFETSK